MPEWGHLKLRHAVSHAQNVRKILEDLDPGHESINCLFKEGGIQICKQWATPILDAKKKRPGTIKSYLTSVVKFLEFLHDAYDREMEGLPNIGKEKKAKLQPLIQRVKTWGSSISRIYECDRWQKILEDSRNAISPADTKDIYKTEPVKKAEELLRLCKARQVTDKEFIAIRDYLIVRLELENGQRPGPMETATVCDFESAESNGEDGFVMYVARHKNSKAGPAPISMKKALHEKIATYVKHVRTHFAVEKENTLFITCAGLSFQDGTIGRRISDWWRKAKGKKYTSTALRKMTVSTLHDADPIDKRKVHSHMCHKQSTADKYYMTGARTRVALESHDIIRKRLGLEEEPEDDKHDDRSQQDAERVKASDSQTYGSTGNLSALTTCQFFEHEREMSSSTCRSRREAWHEDDVTLIEDTFWEFKTRPTKEGMKTIFFSNPKLQEIVARKNFENCYEKVKNIFRRRQR